MIFHWLITIEIPAQGERQAEKVRVRTDATWLIRALNDSAAGGNLPDGPCTIHVEREAGRLEE